MQTIKNIMLMDVLELHDSCEGGISEILGDPFLFQNNIFYRNARNAVLDLGFQFTDEDFCNYGTMPFASLGKILAAKNACICGEIVEVLPLAQATVSQHLKALKEAGLISGTIDGSKSCYCINWLAFNNFKTQFNTLFR